MLATITAVFFTFAIAFAVLGIGRSFAGSVDRMDALFAEHRAAARGRVVSGAMRPVVAFQAAPAPDYAPCAVIALPARAYGSAAAMPQEWRAAA